MHDRDRDLWLLENNHHSHRHIERRRTMHRPYFVRSTNESYLCLQEISSMVLLRNSFVRNSMLTRNHYC